MPTIEQPRIAQLVCETWQWLKFTQVKLATILGVPLHTRIDGKIDDTTFTTGDETN
ncbi:MAG: hypothetical protein V7K89_34120 [Nostoc sp.]|uniref:hypothetical protein n=1 Tax=Nostoc sp. TaxID=1180 RepID=UPI002FF43F90